ncbi:MAG: LpqB family beta-propeller domain-containing protein, partial [Myxococcota bacterium]
MNKVAAALVLSTLFLPGCFLRKKSSYVPPPEEPAALETTGAAQALSRVTSDPITEEWPDLSPDGKTLLFHTVDKDAQGRLSRFAVVGVDPSTGARRTVYTSPKSSSGFPTWMPDGSTYVYTSDAMGDKAVVRALSSSPNAGVSIAVAGNVAPNPSHPSVSPDGKRVAFETFISGEVQVAVSGLDGSNLTILGPGSSPSWHPDNTTIVFHRSINDHFQLFTLNATSGADLVQLTNDESNATLASFAPDGRHVVFVSDRSGKDDLYAIRPDGTVLTALTQGKAAARSPSWGSDGFIYFSSDAAEGNWDIWRFKPVGELALQAAPEPAEVPVPEPAVAPPAEVPVPEPGAPSPGAEPS